MLGDTNDGAKQMMKKRIIGVVLTLLAAGLIGFWYLAVREFTVELTGAQIQEKLNATFPIDKTYIGVVNVRFSHPVVTLKDGSDRVNFSIDADVNVLSNAWRRHGTGQVSGRVRFDPQDGKFYLDDPHVEQFQIDGLPTEYNGVIESGADFAIKPYLDNHPLYQLKRLFFQTHGFGVTVKNIAVQNGVLRITLSPGK